MTTADERIRALLWAGGFLIELARDKTLPLAIRHQAVTIARHFPTIEDVLPDSSLVVASHAEPSTWMAGCRYGPLRDSTHLAWPDT